MDQLSVSDPTQTPTRGVHISHIIPPASCWGDTIFWPLSIKRF